MDLFDELENLAISAAFEEPEEDSRTHHPSHATIKIWQDRFGYTYDEAAALIGITKSATKASPQQPMLSTAQARTIYLLRLDGPLSTPAKVQAAANLPAIPESHVGSSDDGNTVSARLTAARSWQSRTGCPLRIRTSDPSSSPLDGHTKSYPHHHSTPPSALTQHSRNSGHRICISSIMRLPLVKHKISFPSGTSFMAHLPVLPSSAASSSIVIAKLIGSFSVPLLAGALGTRRWDSL